MASLGEIDKHGREQTGLKATKRIVEKAALRPGEGRGRTERVCDVVRAMLVAKDMRTVGAIAEALRALQAEGLIEVRRIKDRFAQPSGGGWRDLMVNLVVLGDEGAVRHVCEVQVAHAPTPFVRPWKTRPPATRRWNLGRTAPSHPLVMRKSC